MTAAGSLLIGGDCGPVHGPTQGFAIESYTELVRPFFEKADARFVNCMRAYSDRGVANADAPQVCQPVEMAGIFTSGLFDAVNMANNHAYDAGPDAMLDTRSLLNSRGVQVTGAGHNLKAARQPAVPTESRRRWPPLNPQATSAKRPRLQARRRTEQSGG